ncbi:MAG: CotH kinase family protein [Bacteroidetes bacterium]|nr:CotH kinase family protein [Bacteroidota bacterium]
MKHLIYIIFVVLFFKDSLSFSQTEGDNLFGSAQVHTVKIYFSQPGWWDSLVAYKPLDKKMLADVEIDGTSIDSAGVQFKGNSSYNAPGIKKSFKIDFNEFVSGKKYDGLKTININNSVNDPTMMREKIYLDFCRKAGIEAPRATYANLYLNDTLWGFYVVVEQVNKTFLEQRYGNNGGNLFKGDANGTLQWYGTNQSSYNGKYELKTNETENNWSDLIHLIDEINNTPPANFYDSLEVVLNASSWIDAWAVNNIFVNLDSYIGTGHNYYIYRNNVTGKFEFILWDVNETFGVFTQGMTITQLENLGISYIPSPSSSRPLTDKLVQNSFYYDAFVNTLCTIVNNYFSREYFDPIIDSTADVIRPYVYADPNKPGNNQQFEDNINVNVMNRPGLKSFITNRRASLISQLAAEGCSVGMEESKNNVGVVIYPNPNKGKFIIEVRSQEPGTISFEIFNVLGEKIHDKTVNIHPATVNINEAERGIYYYRIFLENNSCFSGKFVVEEF